MTFRTSARRRVLKGLIIGVAAFFLLPYAWGPIYHFPEPVAFVGAQGEFVGLDQLNVQIPTSLRGRGTVPVVVTVDGQTTNTVTINVQ